MVAGIGTLSGVLSLVGFTWMKTCRAPEGKHDSPHICLRCQKMALTPASSGREELETEPSRITLENDPASKIMEI
ncbi:hypothetical protein AVEN_111486-1 [Araneus ventricosus]|uniref:Uncharacterized protein n=1 Tax=Araneus ventricosus TaxID=182803 RepID=A0A4Y2NLV4_ARAVE|nr:hypothetical protein AVEN_111486-1 [Araneus ventricosus]